MSIKNKKIYKISIITIFLIGLLCLANKAFAADLAITVNGTTATVSSQYIGRVNLTANGATLSANSVWIENSSEKVTVTVTDKTKGATITATPNNGKMSTSDGQLVEVGAKSATIQPVKEETTQQTQTQQTQQQTTQQTQQTQQQTQTPAQPAEPTFTNTNTTMYTTSDCNLRSSWSTSSAATGVKKGTALNVTGTSTQKINGYTWYRVNYNGTKYIANFLLTSTKPAEEQKEEEKQEEKKEETTDKSSNKALKDLVVENYKLSPDFTPETTKYSLDVKGDVEKLEITPVLQDEKSKFTIEGNDNLKVGNNIVKITVTAEDGTTRIYTIAVSKTNEDGSPVEMLQLKDLKVNNATLSPTFNSEITNYTVEVDDPSSIKASDIVATAADENVEVNISESVNTDKSEKIFTIVLEDKDGTKSGVYQITVKKASMNPIAAIKNNKDNKLYYILGGIIGVLLILIVIILILIKKTADAEREEEEMNEENTSDNYDYSLKNAIDEANAEPEQSVEEQPIEEEPVERANIKSQILNSTPKEYNVFSDNDDLGKTQVFGDLDSEIKEKRKGKHF